MKKELKSLPKKDKQPSKSTVGLGLMVNENAFSLTEIFYNHDDQRTSQKTRGLKTSQHVSLQSTLVIRLLAVSKFSKQNT